MNADLEQLRDIHLPNAIPMWPIAPGWIMIFAILLGLISYLMYVAYQRKQKKITVKYALSKLNMLKHLMIENPNNINIAAEISTLIRRTALHYFHREEIAGLSGNDWLAFLNRSGNTTQFTGETGNLLIDGPYRQNNAADLTSLFVVTKAWLATISKMNSGSLRKK